MYMMKTVRNCLKRNYLSFVGYRRSVTKRDTNPDSEKIMSICAALDVTPEYLLSGVTEDSDRGKNMDYMVIPKGTQERELIELFNEMDWSDRENLLDYARKTQKKSPS